MTDDERDVLQAAFDLVEAQHALDCGSPAQELRKKAMSALMDACAEIAAENEGKLVLSEG